MSSMVELQAGHVPVLVPRQYSEAVDDHQDELAGALREREIVHVAYMAHDLVAAVGLPNHAAICARLRQARSPRRSAKR